MSPVQKKLPVGIQTFAEIVTEGYAYVDKTAHVVTMAEAGKYYFLSRPRRFGKSLFVDTLKEVFEGNEALFRGLYIHGRWDWSRRHPVIKLDFAGGVRQSRQALEVAIRELLTFNQRRLGVSCEAQSIEGCFADLIIRAHEQYGQRVVVLVDEYDKPILDNLAEPELARELRDGLRNLYSVMKAQDAHLQLVFMTGVSKFSKVSLFSGLNNLEDITLDPRFATLCGYTQGELEAVFAEHLSGVDLDEVRRWYNGYNFLGEGVYNPFDVLLYLRNRQFRAYWFESGTPTFLIDLLRRRRFPIPTLEHLEAGEGLLGSFDVESIEPEALLFQAGYLTIHGQRQRGAWTIYQLGYPNSEVRASLPEAILSAYVPSQQEKLRTQDRLYDAVEAGDPEGIHQALRQFFASVPYTWYTRNDIADYEGYYCAVVYCYFAALGLDVVAEDATSQGRIDMSVRLGRRVYVLEFKVTDSPEGDGSAMAQILERGYQRKYAAYECWLIGIEFDRTARNIARFEWRPG